MATLVLQTAGAVVGSFLGGPIGAAIGQTVGALAGAAIDRKLFARSGSSRAVEGPRLKSLDGISSTEGAPIPRVYGRARVGGQMIWATRFEEVTSIDRQTTSGGKGSGGGSSKTTTTTTSYSYFANFAVGLCEGPIASVRRIWADGKEIDRTLYTIRVHGGQEWQMPDPLIVAKEGADMAPAFRGVAYIVFEKMPLEHFGNRLPQLTFEVLRPVDGLASMVRAIDLIPGAGEFVYSPASRLSALEPGVTRSENRHQLVAGSDWTASIDALQALCPNLRSVALVVSWFGDDLRCNMCTIAPRVEVLTKTMVGTDWQVAGLSRAAARPVSLVNGLPAYGGTPSDDTVLAAIADLKARGLSVVFYPFVMMDIAAGNGLADPWSAAGSQPAFPWRGRITCHPAPGRVGSPDGTALAASAIASFFGSASPGYNEWSFRRFILAYAQLCLAAGGVDAFLVGSELVSLTRVRSASGVYPAAQALAAVAADAKAILGTATKVSYGADWSEYGAHVLNNGAEVRFPLDVVWASPAVDFIGIDAYFPLSDWRDGSVHADAGEAVSVYDRDYLARRVSSGEAYDFYYQDNNARTTQTRTPITDGTYGKPWVFRQKDLVGWWQNAHFERMGGVENAAPTAWRAASKPIWLMETGCPAVDRGANAPNVFPDPKSSENALPYFSRGYRDDLMQVRALEAFITHFDPMQAGHVMGSNPVSPVYGGLMVDVARIHLWAWDARPFPAFPSLSSVWSDADNYDTGHWLNGRLEGVALDRLVTRLVADFASPDLNGALPAISCSINGFLDGFVLDRPLSLRGAVEPLAALFGFDVRISGGQVRFTGRTGRIAKVLGPDDFVPAKDGHLVQLSRMQESELPHELSVNFADSEYDYLPATAVSRRIEGYSRRENHADMAVIISRAQMHRLTDIWLRDLWVARESAGFTLRPGLADLEMGDLVTLSAGAGSRLFLIEKIGDGLQRAVTARAVEPAVFDRAPPQLDRSEPSAPAIAGPPLAIVLDLAIARNDPPDLQYLAVFADPWPGSIAVWRSLGAGGYEYFGAIPKPSIIGTTLTALSPGPAGRWDMASKLDVRLAGGAFVSVSDGEALAGKTSLAIQGSDGSWEIFSFARVELVAAKTYRLSRLVRGLGGEEALSTRTMPAGANIVRLDSSLLVLGSGLAGLGMTNTFRVGPSARDYADPACVSVVATTSSKAFRPFAPVQAKAKRSTAGVTISFLRRGRVDSDGWEPVDIPLGEDSEAYEIQIFRAGAAVRLLGTTSPQVLYASADELADFGTVQTSLVLSISQRSASVGRGFALNVSIPVS